MDQAQALLNNGRPAEAAEHLQNLAAEAESSGRLKQAANLHAAAAHALVAAGEESGALAEAETALVQFDRLGMAGRAPTFRRNIAERMRASSMADAAARLEGWGGPAAVRPAPAGGTAPTRGRLPAKCPHCGGPVRSNEVDWIDAHSAECDYCGGVVNTLA